MQRRIRAYTLSARGPAGLLDYGTFFDKVVELDALETVAGISNGSPTRFLLEDFQARGTVYAGYVVSLLVGELETYFDLKSGKLEQGPAPAGKVLARAARVFIDVSSETRVLGLELRGEGISPTSLEKYLKSLARQLLGESYTFDIVPRTEPSVLDEIQELERIQKVEVRVVEPNRQWRDWNGAFSAMLDESGAHKGKIEATAPNRGSLNRNVGVVASIFDGVVMENPNFDSFMVRGKKHGTPGYVEVSSEDHPVEELLEVPEDELVETTDQRALTAFRHLLHRIRRDR